ncbi:MAG: SpoIID/LytB domain-containing protein [Armatimonadota bacterium]
MICYGDPGETISLATSDGVLVIRCGLAVKSISSKCVTVLPKNSGSYIRVGVPGKPFKSYRGVIEIKAKSHGLVLVNTVLIEDYLLGVVPAEMPPDYPMEALKAQAITARTYALVNLGKHSSEGFDLCDTTHCQKYDGVSAETERTTEAVRSTSNLVVVYNGRLATVMYTGDCGGATRDLSQIRPDVGLSYLRGVVEPADMPHSSWQFSVPLSVLRDKLAECGVITATEITGISISRTDKTGRVIDFEVTTDRGKKLVSGEKVRSALGARVMKSLLLTLEQSGDGIVTFKGKGTGHGVGLCQVGARWLASPPRSYTCRQILEHYFPGVQIESMEGLSHNDLRRDTLERSNKSELPSSATPNRTTSNEPGSSVALPLNAREDETGNPIVFDVRVDAPSGL